MNIAPIIPIRRREAFDDPAFRFELKYDGFRALANTVSGRMLNTNGMRRFENLLDPLPADFVFDGEIVCLDDRAAQCSMTFCSTGEEPVYLPFDVLFAHGEDVRVLSLKERKAIFDNAVLRYVWKKPSHSLERGARCSTPFAGSI